MKITVIESSPHKNGSSNMLAGEFIRGAEDAGHHVTVFDAASADIAPCLGCDACGMAGDCCQRDDMAQLKRRYGRLCNTALLFWHVCPVKGCYRQVLQL